MPTAAGQRVLVLGLGASGLAAARLLRAEGADVTAADGREPGESARRDLAACGAACLAPAGDRLEWRGDWAVVSPGIRADHAWLRALRARGLPVIPEMELGWSRRGTARTVAITGSNGKSTLVKLCVDALRLAGVRAEPVGNYGPPVSEVARAGGCDWLVIEASTFQLETTIEFRPDIGVLLNIHPNHLDRHGTLAAYAGLKMRLFVNRQPADTAMLHESTLDWAPADLRVDPGTRVFGTGAGVRYRFAEGFVSGWAGGRRSDIRGTLFDNAILGSAAAAAAGVLEACGADPAALETAARGFVPLPHRMQPVAKIGGVSYVNDSKATNMAALAAALRMIPGPVRLIAGGLLKEPDAESVKDLLVKKCRKVYGIGNAVPVFHRDWGSVMEVENCREMETAVRSAWREARAGETVLLAPGCASFDQYTSFEKRGEHFTCVVNKLEAENRRP